MKKSKSREELQEELASSFLEVLRRGDEEAAAQTLSRALASGFDGPTIYLKLLQPALEQMGTLWERGQALVGEEHRATAMARWLMDALWDEFTPDSYRGDNDRLLAGAAREERHDLGLTMVTRFLRRDGWHVVDLGADVPEGDFAEIAVRVQPRACLLSASLPERLEAVRGTIIELGHHGLQMPVLAGGRVFREDPALATAVGATGTAADAEKTVELVRRLLVP